jgi:hypothetical protein
LRRLPRCLLALSERYNQVLIEDLGKSVQAHLKNVQQQRRSIVDD